MAQVAAPLRIQPPKSAYHPDWYVRRSEAEERALGAMEYPGSAIVLQGPALFGKTWTLAHLLEQCKQRGAVVYLGLRELARAEEAGGLSEFLRDLARQILHACNLEAAAEELDKHWEQTSNKLAALGWLMQRRVLPSFDHERWLILALDGLDVLAGRPWLGQFLGMLRAWMEQAQTRPWSALRLVATMSTSPSLLVQNPDQSPFNVADPIDLGELDAEQVQTLCQLHHLAPSPAELSALRELVGGHPYLVRLALFEAQRRPLLEVLAPASEVFVPFLRHCKRRLRQQPGLLEALSLMLANPRANIDYDKLRQLRHGGFVVLDATGESYRPRFTLFERLQRTPD